MQTVLLILLCAAAIRFELWRWRHDRDWPAPDKVEPVRTKPMDAPGLGLPISYELGESKQPAPAKPKRKRRK